MKQGATFRSDRDLRSQLLPGVAERKKRGDSVGRGLLKFLQLNRFRPGTDWSFPHSQLFSEKRKEKKNEGMEGPPKNSSPPPLFPCFLRARVLSLQLLLSGAFHNESRLFPLFPTSRLDFFVHICLLFWSALSIWRRCHGLSVSRESGRRKTPN